MRASRRKLSEDVAPLTQHGQELAAAIERARMPTPPESPPTQPRFRSFPRAAARRFDAAAVDRLTASWQAYNVAIDAELRTSLDRLRARSRDLFKNNEYAAKFGKMVQTNVVGSDGFVLQAQAKKPNGDMDDADNQAIERAFARWARPMQCDAAGKRSFDDICRAAVLALARDGEFLIRKRTGVAAGAFGYQLQMLDVDRLDTLYNVTAANGRNAIIMGVEVDAYRRPVAYHLWDRHPQEDAHVATRYRERVPAAEILHGFIAIEDEQTRGIPWLAPVMRRLNDLNGYREAAIIAARVGAAKMGFFVAPDGEPAIATDGKDDDGNFITDATPGTFDQVPAGYDFKSFDPEYPHAQFEAFCKSTLRGIASGIGVSYSSIGNDAESVNFSSMRGFVLEERDQWMQIQQWFVDALLDHVYEDWLQFGLTAQQITLLGGSPLPLGKIDKFRDHAWRARRWTWIDPLKDMAANVLAIENGLDSPQRVAAQQGRDVEDVVEDLRRFRDLLDAKGVQLTPQKTPTGSVASSVAGSGTDGGGSAENADAQAAGTDSGRAWMRVLEIIERLDRSALKAAIGK